MSIISAELVKSAGIVPCIWPVDLDGGAANLGDYICLKNYARITFLISIGVTTGTAAVTLYEAKTVAGGNAQALGFTKQYQTGIKLFYDGATGTFVVGETVTGGSSGYTGVVYKVGKDFLLMHTITGTTWTDNETLTGGTSGATASANGTGQDEDILLEKAVASNTFTIPAVSNRTYAIEVYADELSDDYDCIQLRIAEASASCIGSAIAILHEARYKRVPMPTAIYD